MAVATPVTWTAETIGDVFDLLADIDGNLIADITGTTVNLYGGYTADVSAVAATWIQDSNGSSTWTPEG